MCAFLDERVGGASALIAACQSVADRFWHSKLYFPVCFLMLAVFMAAGLPVVGGVLVMSTLIFLLLGSTAKAGFYDCSSFFAVGCVLLAFFREYQGEIVGPLMCGES